MRLTKLLSVIPDNRKTLVPSHYECVTERPEYVGVKKGDVCRFFGFIPKEHFGTPYPVLQRPRQAPGLGQTFFADLRDFVVVEFEDVTDYKSIARAKKAAEAKKAETRKNRPLYKKINNWTKRRLFEAVFMSDSGLTYKEIAAHYGVGVGRIGQVIRRGRHLKWKHDLLLVIANALVEAPIQVHRHE